MLVMTLEYMFHNSHRYFTEILELVRSLNATQNDPQPPSTTPNESLRLVGGFYSTLPFMSPSTTPNVSFRHVGGFLRPLALDHGPIDPQRVEMARWGLPLALNDPQRVISTAVFYFYMVAAWGTCILGFCLFSDLIFSH